METENFMPYITEVLDSAGFDWFVTLGYDPSKQPSTSEVIKKWQQIWEETDPDCHEGWEKPPLTARECLDQWLRDLDVSAGGPRAISYLVVEETRARGVILFHVLVAGWFGSQEQWIWRWREISHGWAFTRQLDDRVAGLLGHFVMRVGYTLEVRSGEFRGSYNAKDFKPWRPKN